MKEFMLERAVKMILNPTNAELAFKKRLIQSKIKFKTQWVIGKYIVDFLIGSIIVEIDGSSHIGREYYDNERTKYLQSKGYTVLRVKNENVDVFDLKRIKVFKKRKKKKPININKISSGTSEFKKLGWDKQRRILQRERLYGR